MNCGKQRSNNIFYLIIKSQNLILLTMSYNDHKREFILKPHIIILLQIFFIRGKRIFLSFM